MQDVDTVTAPVGGKTDSIYHSYAVIISPVDLTDAHSANPENHRFAR